MARIRDIALILLLGLSLPAACQQLYVRNQPFPGKLMKEAGGLWVELRHLELALEFQADLEAEGARINGRLVRTIKQGDTVMVSLSQAAAAVGAVVREEPQFGTIDVHLAMKPKSGTAGLEVETGRGESAAGASETVQTAAFSFPVPAGMQVSRDPRLIKSFLQQGGPPLGNQFKLDALLFYKGDTHFKKGAAVFSWFQREIPKGMQEESTLLNYQYDLATIVLDDIGVQLIDAPKLIETEAQRFVLAAGVERKPPHKGMMLLFRIDPKKNRFYQVMTANIPQTEEGPTNDFLKFMTTVTTR